MNEQLPPDPPLATMSNTEAIQTLTDGRFLSALTAKQKDAVLRAVHLVARRSAQKERNARSRRARGVCFTPDAVLANHPFAPTPAPETNPDTETEAANE